MNCFGCEVIARELKTSKSFHQSMEICLDSAPHIWKKDGRYDSDL